MNKSTVVCCLIGLLLFGPTIVFAHPHYNKTVSVSLPGAVEATITYTTVPVNETLAAKAAVGSFLTIPRQPKLKLSAALKAGNVSIPAGLYVIGVVKNGEEDWTMALYSGELGFRAQPDMSKLIKLDSMYSRTEGTAEHLLVDISPGTGRFEGEVVLTAHFGSMFFAGALTKGSQ